jgi:phage recombination protein Bet
VNNKEERMNELATLQPPSLLTRMATQYGVEPNKMLSTLKATAFKGEVSNEQMMALLIVANQHGLNPWTKEIYAFPDKNNGIVPVVGVDGWSRIINDHPQSDGIEFTEPEDGLWCECTIFRKDRAHPIKVREYLSECKRNTGPWGSHPRRMLRHKAMIQCARVAYGFSGIYDPDEAERIVEGERVDEPVKRIGLGVDAFMSATEEHLKPVLSESAPPASTDAADLSSESTGMQGTADQGAPTIADVSALIQKGDLDAAADLARSFPPAERAVLESEIKAKMKKAKA